MRLYLVIVGPPAQRKVSRTREVSLEARLSGAVELIPAAPPPPFETKVRLFTSEAKARGFVRKELKRQPCSARVILPPVDLPISSAGMLSCGRLGVLAIRTPADALIDICEQLSTMNDFAKEKYLAALVEPLDEPLDEKEVDDGQDET